MQSTKRSFIDFTQLVDTFTIQATWTINLTLHFNYQHLGTCHEGLKTVGTMTPKCLFR